MCRSHFGPLGGCLEVAGPREGGGRSGSPGMVLRGLRATGTEDALTGDGTLALAATGSRPLRVRTDALPSLFISGVRGTGHSCDKDSGPGRSGGQLRAERPLPRSSSNLTFTAGCSLCGCFKDPPGAPSLPPFHPPSETPPGGVPPTSGHRSAWLQTPTA